MNEGRYRYVRYDRRNGPIVQGTVMYLRDPKTFEVDLGKSCGPMIGCSLIATKWSLADQIMWHLTGRPELGDYSPVRFFFVQETGWVRQVA
jgi:hypothetical protein